jgi:hypothetical protein
VAIPTTSMLSPTTVLLVPSALSMQCKVLSTILDKKHKL